MIPPVAGVMIASYWVIHKGHKDSWAEVEGVNRLGVFFLASRGSDCLYARCILFRSWIADIT